jgi:hypothetical protein
MSYPTILPRAEEDSAAELLPDHAAADAYILELYSELLRRQPAEAEREGWVTAILAGQSFAQVREAFVASDEYRDARRLEEFKAAVLASGLFDAAWYARTYADVVAAGLDPLDHYCQFGRFEHRAPNGYLDPIWYGNRAATAEAGDALLDYMRTGERHGLTPGPNFDPEWYRNAYKLPEDVSPLAHFLRHRNGRRFAPCPRLWSLTGLPPEQDAGDENDPFQKYLAPGDDLANAVATDLALLGPSGLFDENYYQIVNDDVFSSGMDALTHYCVFGWKEKRNPNFYFQTDWYSATNPEVERLGVNPLVHYKLVGEPAGRRPVVFFEPDWYRKTYGLEPGASPLAHYLAHRRSQRFSPNSLFDPEWYLAHCGELLHHRRDPFAHYLVAGMHQDLQPSPQFDAAAWRRQAQGRPTRAFRYSQSPERDNPLVHYLLTHYK